MRDPPAPAAAAVGRRRRAAGVGAASSFCGPRGGGGGAAGAVAAPLWGAGELGAARFEAAQQQHRHRWKSPFLLQQRPQDNDAQQQSVSMRALSGCTKKARGGTGCFSARVFAAFVGAAAAAAGPAAAEFPPASGVLPVPHIWENLDPYNEEREAFAYDFLSHDTAGGHSPAGAGAEDTCAADPPVAAADLLSTLFAGTSSSSMLSSRPRSSDASGPVETAGLLQEAEKQQQETQQQEMQQQEKQQQEKQQQTGEVESRERAALHVEMTCSATGSSCWRMGDASGDAAVAAADAAAEAAAAEDHIWEGNEVLQQVSTDSFDSLLQQYQWLLLLFYFPAIVDGQVPLLPAVFDAAERLQRLGDSNSSNFFVAGKVDATAEEVLPGRLGVTRFPCLKLVNVDAKAAARRPETGTGKRKGGGAADAAQQKQQQQPSFSTFDYTGPFVADEILRWVLRQQSRFPVVLNGVAAVDRFLFDHPFTVLGIFKKDSPEEAVFREATREMKGVTAALAHDLAVAARLGLQDVGVALFVPHEQRRILYPHRPSVSAQDYVTLIKEHQYPAVTPLSPATSRQLFEDGRPLLVLLRRKDTAGMRAEAAFREIAPRYRRDLLATVAEGDLPFLRRLKAFLFVEGIALPAVVLVENAASQISALRFRCEEPLTRDGLSRFIGQYLKLQLVPIRKSSSLASLPPQEGALIRDLVAANFENEVLRSQNEVLLFVYVPWCAHSAKFRLVFEEVAQHLGVLDGLLLAQLDGSVNDVEGLNVVAYSTLIDLRRKAGPHARHGDGLLLPRLGIDEDPEKFWDDRETALSDLLAADGYPSLLFYSSPDETKTKKVVLYDGVRDVPSVLDFLVLHSARVAEQRLGGL